jgi:hypothetical protein
VPTPLFSLDRTSLHQYKHQGTREVALPFSATIGLSVPYSFVRCNLLFPVS